MRYVGAEVHLGEDRKLYQAGSGGVTNTQRAFNVAYENGQVEAYLNGVRLFPGSDYAYEASGTGAIITLVSDIGASNVLEVVGFQGRHGGDAVAEFRYVVGVDSGSYTDESTTVFPATVSTGDLVSVFRNGVKLVHTTDFVIDSGASTVTLQSAASANDEITIQVTGALAHADFPNKTGMAGAVFNTGSDSFIFPTTRGADAYVMTRDDTAGTGGTSWKETLNTPVITSVSGVINEDTNTELTVVGTAFASGMTLKLINATSGVDIAGHTALSYSGSTSPLTVTIPSATTNITAGTQVKLNISKQGLSALSDAITVSEDPNWTTNAGTIATIFDLTGTSANVGLPIAAGAGAGGGTIVYSSDDSSLDTSYFVLNSSSGQITTHASTALSGISGSWPYTESFNANASISGDATKNTVRAFNIIVNQSPTTSGAYDKAMSDYKYHTYTTVGSNSGTFVCYGSLTADILVVAGGGGGGGRWGGGGGAGGLVLVTGVTLVAGTYNITIGIGGTAGTGGTSSAGTASEGGLGGDSTFIKSSGTTLTAKGGAGGTAYDTNDGVAGGSTGGTFAHGTAAVAATANQSSQSQTYTDGELTHNAGYAGGRGAQGGGDAGGGGGAGSVGVAGALSAATWQDTFSDGGDGIEISWATKQHLVSGQSATTPLYFAGGGGGGAYSATTTHKGGDGQAGGGGGSVHNSGSNAAGLGGTTSINNGSNGAIAGVAGSAGANTGSGGGGGTEHSHGGAGAGGSGIVVIRYAV